MRQGVKLLFYMNECPAQALEPKLVLLYGQQVYNIKEAIPTGMASLNRISCIRTAGIKHLYRRIDT